MYTIKNNIKNEIIINKSKFITYIYKVKTKEEVELYLDKLKKEYKDATHICYGYIIDNYKRFSDDNEPNGTAGLPILNVLENNKLNYIAAFVIRYFGGIKLGAGGLVRAYTKATSDCLLNTNLKELVNGYNITITFTYDNVKTIDNLLKDFNIRSKSFDEKIRYNFDINNSNYENIKDILILNTDNIDISKEIIIEE